MRLWLDDVREPPDDSWTWAQTVPSARWYFDHFDIEHVSLDNDLGEGEPEGRMLVRWMAETGRWPAIVDVHSSNVPAAEYMRGMIQRYKPDAGERPDG